jgi:hypothetical protein
LYSKYSISVISRGIEGEPRPSEGGDGKGETGSRERGREEERKKFVLL